MLSVSGRTVSKLQAAYVSAAREEGDQDRRADVVESRGGGAERWRHYLSVSGATVRSRVESRAGDVAHKCAQERCGTWLHRCAATERRRRGMES